MAYRKAGYSKKFREEHEEEILLHQAAKNAFDEMGVKKLPKVRELQTEYAIFFPAGLCVLTQALLASIIPNLDS